MSDLQATSLPSEGIREPVTVKAHLLGISPNGLRATVRFDTGDDHTTTVVLPSDAVIRKARGRRYDLLSTEQPKADIPLVITDADLHPDTARLVTDFAQALADKLLAAEMKYGYSNGWMNWDWMDECRDKLREHLAKGDPRDVAAYCAFLWFHGEPTAKKTEQAERRIEYAASCQLKNQPPPPPPPKPGDTIRDLQCPNRHRLFHRIAAWFFNHS